MSSTVKEQLIKDIDYHCHGAEYQWMKAKQWETKGEADWANFHKSLARERELRAIRLLVSDNIELTDLISNAK
jgi:hypothetical protein